MTIEAPLHERIRRAIETRIMSGDWKPGHRIPYEHELEAEYACSRMTVSKALGALVQAGLLERRKRAGTFVAAPRFHRAALEIPDIRDEVASQGRTYGLELIERSARRANAADRALLGGASGRLLAIDCRHLADGRPYAIEQRLISLAAVPSAIDADFTVDPPGSWLLDHVPWTEAEHRITAINADAATARLLAVDIGQACICLERWTWRGDERITYARQVYPGGSYGLVAHFRA
ncbi:MAG: histidine utilization repressor [Sphingomonas sanxanigenens]|uniref:Histidine utilization repressor n=1 Tax=Sphingomonas sanxanigenens TaxID=397260 RepID=A0A2W5AC98_9SPHN|nr:MAG: histidine utilization repressor [Sphingomonas sanxanigenens]